MTNQLFHALRFASDDVHYPLPINGSADWRRGAAPVRIALPDVPANHIIAASFASPSTAASFSFRLSTGGDGWFETTRFGGRARRRERHHGDGVVAAVDYFDVARNLAQPSLSLLCRASKPQRYLVAVSIRPREVAAPDDSPDDVGGVAATKLSQLTLPTDIRLLACSPTATAMALGIAEHDDFEAFVASARHPPTGMYGVWPHNLWAAARRGALGALELFSDWRQVTGLLAKGARVVASIRFREGELDGSPRPQTGGHLVLLRGIDNGEVVVNDPAAPPDCVERRYDVAQFARAWFRYRGAGYVFASDTEAAGP